MPSEATLDAAPAAEPVKKGKGKLIAILIVLLAGGGAGGWYLTHGKADPHAGAKDGEHGEGAESAAPTTAVYLPMTPPFVVNLSDTEALRYLQADMELMARDPKVIEDAKLHMPHIRDRILLLLSQQRTTDINTREGKEALQAKILAEIQSVLKQETGKPGIDAVYFTSFVMQ